MSIFKAIRRKQPVKLQRRTVAINQSNGIGSIPHSRSTLHEGVYDPTPKRISEISVAAFECSCPSHGLVGDRELLKSDWHTCLLGWHTSWKAIGSFWWESVEGPFSAPGHGVWGAPTWRFDARILGRIGDHFGSLWWESMGGSFLNARGRTASINMSIYQFKHEGQAGVD
eukprot:1156510-Pelagomonas_calceolata.AAC.12